MDATDSLHWIVIALCAFSALFHIGAGIKEITDGPGMVRRLVGKLPEQAVEPIRVLLINQGVYNFFLAAGLIWGIASGRAEVAWVFLAFVAIAGLVGYVTLKSRLILILQAMPGILGLLVLFVT